MVSQAEILKGVPGILRPFKEYITKRGAKPGDELVYFGVPGTCTPFVELLGFALRSMELKHIFVPLVATDQARELNLVPDIGMQAGSPVTITRPMAVVIMGGLAMPGSGVSATQVKAAIAPYTGSAVVGVCFMNMFEKAGWLREMKFDLMIDATIDPVRVFS